MSGGFSSEVDTNFGVIHYRLPSQPQVLGSGPWRLLLLDGEHRSETTAKQQRRGLWRANNRYRLDLNESLPICVDLDQRAFLDFLDLIFEEFRATKLETRGGWPTPSTY
jgi:hypothetical protein